MNYAVITKDSMQEALGREIPDVHMLVAKNSVLGLDSYGIADILGVAVEEVQAIEAEQEYKEVRVHIAAHWNNLSVQKDMDWDSIEARALMNIGKRVEYETDINTNLKIAAIANRATRRHQTPLNRPLDASAAGARVHLNLTSRIIERLKGDGTRERETIREVSLRHGSVSNPSFADIDGSLGISARPRIPSNLSFRTPEPIDDEQDRIDLGVLDRMLDDSIAKRKK